jgi:type VI secretion system protein ImpF
MARSLGDVNVTLSVLDRLVDQEPDNSVEAPFSRAQSVRMLKAAVRRDLGWLLNTHRIVEEPDEALKEVNRSLYMYGLPDFSNYTMSSAADQAKLARFIASAIKFFEPRLANVRVVQLETPGTVGLQQVKLRIEGMLLMDPSPEPISFDTVIELKSGACHLSGDAHAG